VDEALKSQGFQVTKTLIGPQGDKGDRGDQGEKGDQGAPGPQGPRGFKGEDGNNGKDGLPGIQGSKGDRGERGEQGSQGFIGDKGDIGEPGPKGDKGDQGEQGPPPKHEITDDKIRFELPTGGWGNWIDLKKIIINRVGGGATGGGTVGNGTDVDAVHVNVADEFSVIPEDTTPASGDWILAEDAITGEKKIVQIGNLPAGTASATWTDYATKWDTAPTFNKAISGGSVYNYTLNSVTRYRFVPTTYDAAQDAFYASFNDMTDTLTTLIVARGF
jgi:hypothetical protein